MDQVEEIKTRLDIADIVTEYLPLKPAGTGSFKACCPFHQEKTPSFYVNRGRQSWHCFGCNEGGDVISFIEKIEGMEFIEALELLAQKAGVTLQKLEPKQQGLKKRLYDANEYAAKLFRHILLTEAEATTARSYTEKRGLDEMTTDEWKLGYAPADMAVYSKKFFDQGFTADDLVQAGIASKNDNGSGIYFRFKSRLIFPIWDAFGHHVGFTARILTAEKLAKYINTPETLVYKKSGLLYGLDKAKSHIKREDLAVVVEGNMDCITSHQFGVKNVVASSGTALTTEQLQLIKRFTDNIAIAFDADSAGLNATIRGLDLARKLDFNIRIINYKNSGAKDPDELIRQDVEFWKDAIKQAKPIMEWVYQQAFSQNPSITPEGKKNIARQVLGEIRLIADPVERDAWMVKLANDLGVGVEALRSAMGKQVTISPRKMGGQAERKEDEDYKKKLERADTEEELEELWLAAHILDKTLTGEAGFNWHKNPHNELYNLMKQGYTPAEIAGAGEEIKKLYDYLNILADKEFGDLDRKTQEKIAREIGERLITRQRALKKKDLEQQMRAAELAGDDGRIKQLIEEFNRINN